MKQRLLIAYAMLEFFGCGAEVRWTKPGASDAEFQRDQRECYEEADHADRPPTNPFAATAHDDTFNRCMQKKGWTRQ